MVFSPSLSQSGPGVISSSSKWPVSAPYHLDRLVIVLAKKCGSCSAAL